MAEGGFTRSSLHLVTCRLFILGGGIDSLLYEALTILFALQEDGNIDLGVRVYWGQFAPSRIYIITPKWVAQGERYMAGQSSWTHPQRQSVEH